MQRKDRAGRQREQGGREIQASERRTSEGGEENQGDAQGQPGSHTETVGK